MKRRLLLILGGFAIGCVLTIFAQQTDSAAKTEVGNADGMAQSVVFTGRISEIARHPGTACLSQFACGSARENVLKIQTHQQTLVRNGPKRKGL